MKNLEECMEESRERIIAAIEEISRGPIVTKTEIEVYDILTGKYNLPLDCAFEVYESLIGGYKNELH